MNKKMLITVAVVLLVGYMVGVWYPSIGQTLKAKVSAGAAGL